MSRDDAGQRDATLHEYEVTIRSWGPSHEPGEADYDDYVVEAEDRGEAKELAWDKADLGFQMTGEIVQAEDLGAVDEQLVTDGGTPATGGQQMVNKLALVNDDGGNIVYDGPFEFLRDGGRWELIVPIGEDEYAGIHEQTAETLSERVGDLALALADGGLEASGYIETAEIIEGQLVFGVDDGNHLSPSEVDVDLSEVEQ